ncbi:MAG: ThuA domain-containing protein [Candidatus Hinthialibacter sp.]
MKNVWIIGLALLMAAAGVSSFAQEKPEPIQVLLISGDDVAPFHDWREIADSTRKVLENSGRFNVIECEDTFILDSKAALDKYDVILLTGFNANTPSISDQAKENLLNFVKSGKGFMVNHLASASFKEWDEFGELCGRKWVMGTSGHGSRSMFTANIVNKEHPITQGLEDFQIFDELYAKLQGRSKIDVLITADSDWSGNTEPMLFVREYGEGRVVHNAFGHDHKAIENETNKILLIRSCEWAATGKVTKCGCAQ